MYFKIAPCSHTFVHRYEGAKETKDVFERRKCKICKEEFFVEDVINGKVFTVADFIDKMATKVSLYPNSETIKKIHKAWNLDLPHYVHEADKADVEFARKTYVTNNIYELPGHEFLGHPEAIELFSKFPDPLEEYEKVHMSNFLIAEIDNGNWAKIETFINYSLKTEANAIVNWKE